MTGGSQQPVLVVIGVSGSGQTTVAALLAGQLGWDLAEGCCSLFPSHVNEAGFWLVKEMFGPTVGQTFKTWSVTEALVSIVGFSFVMPLSAFF